jgi:hypothetical protein
MDGTLVGIKRLLLAGQYQFSFKAESELLADGLSEEDDVEAIMNAPAITKVLRSRSRTRTSPREWLYVIVGATYDGVLVYSKGAIRRIAGEETFYFLVSSKRWVSG